MRVRRSLLSLAAVPLLVGGLAAPAMAADSSSQDQAGPAMTASSPSADHAESSPRRVGPDHLGWGGGWYRDEPCGFYRSDDRGYYNNCSDHDERIRVDYRYRSRWDDTRCVAPGITYLGRDIRWAERDGWGC